MSKVMNKSALYDNCYQALERRQIISSRGPPNLSSFLFYASKTSLTMKRSKSSFFFATHV